MSNEISENHGAFYEDDQYWFIIDVESVGLHGEGFAVAYGVYQNGIEHEWGVIACDSDAAEGGPYDREWAEKNVKLEPHEISYSAPRGVRSEFWSTWGLAKLRYPGIVMVGECIWPVETNFLHQGISDRPDRSVDGPYPLLDITNWIAAAGMDPMEAYERRPDELPVHHPMGDVRLSARLFHEALRRLNNNAEYLNPRMS